MTSSVVSDRVDAGRCAGCNRVTVDAWLCDSCSFNTRAFTYRYADERRAPTATVISRAQQARADRSAMIDQFMALQTDRSEARLFNARETGGIGSFQKLPTIPGVDRREIGGRPSRNARREIRRALRDGLLGRIMRPAR